MAAGATYTPIATTTLGSNQTTVTFSSISTAYTDLVVVFVPASSSGTNGVRVRVGNGSLDTGSNYSGTYLNGNGTSAISNRDSNASQFQFNNSGTTTTLGNQVSIMHFLNYSNTTTYKTFLARNNSASANVEQAVGLWRSTSAINIIAFNINTFGSSTGDFITGSTFTLYGIVCA